MGTTMTPADRLQTYITLVSNLTGVSERVVGQAETAAQYLNTYTAYADGIAGLGATDILLDAYKLLLQSIPPVTATETLWSGKMDSYSPDSNWPFSAMVRNLMKLVLLGAWFDPNNPKDDGTIPTAASYTESLVWLIGQAHPVGNSAMPYGHWANPPPPLKGLIG